jgi:hypothetical protein
MNLYKIWDNGVNPEEQKEMPEKCTEKAIMDAHVIFLIKGMGFKYGV